MFRLEAYLGVPVRVAGKVYGVVSFGSPDRRPQPFSEEEKEIVEVLGRHLEVVVGGQEQLNRVVTALNEIAGASPATFFEKLALKTADLLEAEHVVEQRGHLVRVGRVEAAGADDLQERAERRHRNRPAG